jgi:multiple sugar transport system permease protein
VEREGEGVAQAEAVRAPVTKRGYLRRKLHEARNEWTAYLFLSPGLVLFFAFFVYPLIFSFWISFHEWDILQPQKPFVGLQNYRDMLHDSGFISSIWHTLYFTIGTIPLELSIALVIAVLLNAQIRGLGLFRTLYYLPVVTPLVVASIIWKWVYNTDYGLANYYLLKLHLIGKPLLWLSSSKTAMPAVIIMTVWKAVGFNMIVYLAGLQAIPAQLYEAAEVDGASSFKRFWRITIPMLAPTTLFLVIISFIGSFQVFTQIFIMTQGGPPGPGGATTTIMYYIYRAAFLFFQMGYAAALAYALFAMLLVFSIWQFRYYMRQAEA